MDDNTALERQIGVVLGRMGGPEPTFDAMAVARAAATQSRTRRFQTMFSALKFVVAGAIVALFGGFLLSGVLTQRSSDEPLPPAAASASASPEADVTATPEQPARSDLLPGVDLVAEEVEPGLYKVLSDGVRDLTGAVHDVKVGAEGEVWVELGGPREWSVALLGAPGASETLGRKKPWRLYLTPEGVPVVTSQSGLRVLDGEAWAKAEPSAYEECAMFPGPGVALGGDGGCWVREQDNLTRIDPDGSRTTFSLAEIGLDAASGLGVEAVGPDGTIWWRVHRPTAGAGGIFVGLLAYDGSTWSFTPYEGDAAEEFDGYIGVDAEGVVWVSRMAAGVPPILRWDGASWTPIMLDGDPGVHLWPWPNGVLWLGAVASTWDGTTLTMTEPAITTPAYWYTLGGPFGTAPDGSTWVALDGDLYVVTPYR